MKKIFVFLINNQPVDKLNGDDIYFDTLTQFKRDLALAHQVSEESIEVVPQDVYEQEYSRTLSVTENGLQYRNDNPYASWRPVDCPVPALDISQPELFEEFLELLGEKDIDNAITFI